MRVCVIGAGYVGLTTGTVLAEFGHEVYCIDRDEAKINLLNRGTIPIYEPGLTEMVMRNKKQKKLYFTTNIIEAVNKCPIILIAVGTPPCTDGSPNLTYLENVIDEISKYISSHKTIIIKSTVPPGTNEWVDEALHKKGLKRNLYDIVSNPEFLREGSAVSDMLHPDKIVVGVKRPEVIKTMQLLYQNINAPFIFTTLNGAEMIKYASNAFLATKISFMNEIARICDAYNVDIKDVALGLSTDPRIGSLFLNSGLGFGGSCFPKDLQALEHAAKQKNIITEILIAVQNVNRTQINLYIDKLHQEFPSLKNKKITVWGLSFKPNTDDTRFSKALSLIEHLKSSGADIHAYDPIVTLNSSPPICHKDIYESIENTDALIIATEWDQFSKVDWNKVSELMRGNIVIDGRNFIEPYLLKRNNLKYIGVARP